MKKILIAEDDEMMLKTMEFRLVKEGYHVIYVQTDKLL